MYHSNSKQTASEDLLNFQSGNVGISQKIKQNSHMSLGFLLRVPFRMPKNEKNMLGIVAGIKYFGNALK